MTMQPLEKYQHSIEPPALFLYILLLQLFLCGCSSSAYLPSAKETVRSPWGSFNEVKAAFDQIQPYQTDIAQLGNLGFTPESSPNIRILNHLDIMQRFLTNQSISLRDLDEGLQDCLAAKHICQAYEILIRQIDEERYGNVLLDLLNFRRKTSISGWEFKALVVLKGDLTVYTMYGGKPTINESRDQKNPFGPLQSSERIWWNVVQ